MADHCNFCDTRRPCGGTNILVAGDNWFEFCPTCGELETLTNAETGETITVAELFRRSGGTPTPADPARIAAIKAARREHEEALAALAAARNRKEAARKAKLRGGLDGSLFHPKSHTLFLTT